MNERLIQAMESYLENFGERPSRWNSTVTDGEFIEKIEQAIKNKSPIVEDYPRENIH